MKMWISKYALTAGITEESGEIVRSHHDYFSTGPHGFYRIGKDAHHTRVEAEKAAEAMRIKKIASLKKQVKVLETLSFSGGTGVSA